MVIYYTKLKRKKEEKRREIGDQSRYDCMFKVKVYVIKALRHMILLISVMIASSEKIARHFTDAATVISVIVLNTGKTPC